ncbi:MAG TPA: AAA family ATPase [Devosia sp.]|nr:AAA family ATPase [Devosia sp.]
MDNFVVITGGPGAGKTTLIDALAMLGHGRTIEAGRFIIEAQAGIGGMGVHWGDRQLFAELMLMHEIRSYEEAHAAPGLVFFDRGVPELMGYLRMSGRPVLPHFRKAAATCRYNRTVFAAPPWREIYVNDTERKQAFSEAVATYEACRGSYADAGYEVIDLPKASVGERVRFVLGKLTGAV